MKKEQKPSQTTEPAIAVEPVLAPVVWGVNKFGQQIKEHDKLSCGNGHDTWFTHVMFDTERNYWHREHDYYNSKVVGSYNGA
jgi:hypothetical protein